MSKKPVFKKKPLSKVEKLPQVGDVIVSAKFAYGHRSQDGEDVVTVDGETKKYPVIYGIDEEERVALAVKTGKTPPKERKVDFGAYDKSRGTAKFVVEDGEMTGGGRSHNDVYPDGWHVTARRLNDDGTYNPKGERIQFFMTGCFSGLIEAKDVKVVGKMKRHVTFL